MKKLLMPLLATTLLLTGCGGGSGELPAGGKEVTASADIAEQLAKGAKSTVDGVENGAELKFTLDGEFKYEVEKQKFNITGLGGELTITAEKFLGKKVSELKAAVSIKGLSANIDVAFDDFSFQTEIKSVNIDAYLDKGVVYANLSDKNLSTAAITLFKKFSPGAAEMTDEQINAAIDELLGKERKAYLALPTDIASTQIPAFKLPDVKLLSPVIEAYLKQITDQGITLKDLLTVKTYDDGRIGAKVGFNKDTLNKVIAVVAPDQKDALKDFEKCEASLVVLTDTSAKLASIELKEAIKGKVNDGTLDSSLTVKVAASYGKSVTLPSDLSSYKEVKLSSK